MTSAEIERAAASLRRPRDCPWRLELTKAFAHASGGRGAAWLAPIAFALAFARLVADVARHGQAAKLPPADAIAVTHGEWSNRTRPLLELLPAEAAPPLIVVGRPRGSLDEVRALLARNRPGVSPVLVRPLSVSALLAALPAMMAQAVRGIAAVARARPAPRFGALAAISYRVFAGEVHARWWRSTGASPDAAVFAHTGIADTTLLERAMQAGGTKTVHLLHGLSTGWDFDGLSDLLIARCGHDARMHATLGGYRATAWLETPPPPVAHPSRPEWLLLTNLAHPTGAAYAEHGVAPEIAAITATAEAARKASATLVWRRHPSFEQLAGSDRALVEQAAADAGAVAWPEPLGYERIADFATIVTTPSTALVDLLRMGRVPVVVAPDGAAPDALTLYHAYPWRAADCDLIAGHARAIAANPEAALVEAWGAIAPAAPFDDWTALSAFVASSVRVG